MKRHAMYIMYIMIASLTLLPPSAHAVDIGQIVGQAITGAAQLAEAAKEITPSEEHYIGRAVAAMVVNKYPLLDNALLTKYINEVGLLTAAVSERPSTYGGYHFAVLDSDEPNAYACPGGLIFINKGLLKEIKNEDQLAAVLAHEISHVAYRHGISAIKKSRWTKFAFYTAGEVGKHYAPDEMAQLVGEFQGVVTDVAKKVIESGYGIDDEKYADEMGAKSSYAAGYNSSEMIDFLRMEKTRGIGHPSGPFKSHPTPDARIAQLEGITSQLGPTATDEVRTNRFKAATASLK